MRRSKKTNSTNLSRKLLIRKARTKIGCTLSQPPPGVSYVFFSPRTNIASRFSSLSSAISILLPRSLPHPTILDKFCGGLKTSSYSISAIVSSDTGQIPRTETPLDRILDDDTAYIHFLFLDSLENFYLLW